MRAVKTLKNCCPIIRVPRFVARDRGARFGNADYRMKHQAPDVESGAPLFNLTANGIYPRDFYDRMHEYRPHHDADFDAMNVIHEARGKPEKRVHMCRAVPKGVKTINPGDWVAITRAYARDHGRHGSDPSQDMPVICALTEAKNLYSNGDSFHEWGYVGQKPVQGTVVFRPRKALTQAEREAKNREAKWKRTLARISARKREERGW
jgi:hypothetical protein